MDFQELEVMRRNHPGWRLLTADHVSLVVSFLYRSFIEPNIRTLPESELISRLEDHLFHLRELCGIDSFPKAASAYLDDWAAHNRGWLRKYYPPGNDEAHFDLTTATEKAIDWLSSLKQRPFVGTESRLRTVFELLRQLTAGTQTDPNVRLAELKRRQAELEAELQRVQNGDLALMNETQIKDCFLQMATTARGLLSDFREVEQNFRELDRSARERIATWDGGKGTLLEQIFSEREAIGDSDQGRSFRAFWDFLMSQARQEELTRLLEEVIDLPAVRALNPDYRLRRVHFDWLEAGESAQRTVARLSAELRRFLDDQAWIENRRIMQLIHEIEQHALAARQALPEGNFMDLDDCAPAISLVMDRPLFSPPFKPHIVEQVLVQGDGVLDDSLFEQMHVDRQRLARQLRQALQTRQQISLAQLLEIYPLEHGLAELLTYLTLATEDSGTVIDETHTQTVTWYNRSGQGRKATLPIVIWSR